MKICVLTSNIGKKDNIIFNDNYLSDDIDYYYYTDDITISHNIWKIKKNPSFSHIDRYQDRRNAKIIKCLGFLFEQNYDYYLWMDSNLVFKQKIKTFITDNLDENFDICIFRHGIRKNIVEEANELIAYKLDDTNLIKYQIQEYLKNQVLYALYEMPCFLYKNNINIQNFLMTWYEQINKYSSRDQLSFSHALSYYDLKVKFFKNTVYDNEYFHKVGHIK